MHTKRARHEDAQRFGDANERLNRQRLAEINRHSKQMRDEENFERVGQPAGKVGRGAEQKMATILPVEFEDSIVELSQAFGSPGQSTHRQERDQRAEHAALLKPKERHHDASRQHGDGRAFQDAQVIAPAEWLSRRLLRPQ